MRCNTFDYFLCGGWQKKSPATEGKGTYFLNNKDSNNLSNNQIITTDSFEDACRDKVIGCEQYPSQPIGIELNHPTPTPQDEDEDEGKDAIGTPTWLGRVEPAKGTLAPTENNGHNMQPDYSIFENPKENPNEITSLPIWALPTDIQSIVDDVTRGYRCNRDYVVGSLMGAVACLVGKRVTAHRENYINHATLWLAIVGDSATGKSQPLNFFFKPIQDEEDELYNRYKQELQQWKDNDCKGNKPEYKHRIINNPTDEAILKELDINGDACLYADELRGIFEGFGSYNKTGGGTIIGNLLTIFDYGSISVLRVSSEPKRLKHPHLNLIGTTQPSILKRFMGNKGFTEDGLFQRILFVYPEQRKRPARTKHIISVDSKRRWGKYARSLSSATFADLFETASAEALHDEVLKKWDLEIEEYRQEGIPEMISLISKLDYHLCRWCACVAVLRGEQRIEEDVMRYSIECMEYFKWCGERALCLLHNRPSKREPTAKELIQQLFKKYPNMVKSKVAEGLGITRQTFQQFFNN